MSLLSRFCWRKILPKTLGIFNMNANGCGISAFHCQNFSTMDRKNLIKKEIIFQGRFCITKNDFNIVLGTHGINSHFTKIGSLHYSTDSKENSNPKVKKPDYEITKKKEINDPKQETNSSEPEPVSMTKRIQIVVGIVAIWGVIYFIIKYLKSKEEITKREEQVSQIDIGAKDYELIDHLGQKRTKADFMGQWLLLYFGFTHCPDICPEELEKMAEIIDLVDKDKSVPDILPIFISVDPERDTPEVVKNYIAEFHKKFVGLTGTKEQVKQAAKTFRVYFSAGPRDEDNDYIVDHTIVMYLMNPAGNFVDYYGSRGVATPDIVSGIKKNMKNYKRLHG
ncbi:protein SCO2 homolog, mitochondrial-like [Styela clava]